MSLGDVKEGRWMVSIDCIPVRFIEQINDTWLKKKKKKNGIVWLVVNLCKLLPQI